MRWVKTQLGTVVTRGLVAVSALAGVLAAGIFAFWAVALPALQDDAGRLVAHTLRVISTTSTLEGHLAMMTSEGRGYIVDGNADTLRRFNEAVEQIEADFATLRAETVDNPVQQATIERLQPLIAARVARLQEIVARIGRGDMPGAMAMVGTHGGRLLHDDILTATASVKAEQRRLLDLREDAAREAARLGTGALVLYTILVVVAGLATARLVAGSARSRRDRQELAETNAELEARVAARTAELAASVARQRSYFNHSPVGEIVLRAEPSGYLYEDMNPAAEAIFGVKPTELIGRALPHGGPAALGDALQPGLVAYAAGDVTARYEVASPARGVERMLDVAVAPLNGQLGGERVLVCVQDVTATVQLQRRLAIEAERAAEAAGRELALFRNSPDILFTARVEDGPQGPEITYEAFSPALERLTGLKPADLVGCSPGISQPEQGRAETVAQFRQCVLSGTTVSYTATYVVPVGRRDFETSLSPVRHPTTGKIVHLVGALRDVTERNQLEAALRHGQKMEAIGRLAAGVAHDFNNILQTVLGGLELVLDDVQEKSLAHNFATLALNSAKRGATLTQHLLSYARKQMLQPEPIALPAFLTELQSLLSRTLGPHIAVTALADPSGPRVTADPGQLETALLNLAINGAHAMQDGGVLTIRAASVVEAGQPWVTLTVSDTGCGMDEATLAQATEPFFTTKGAGGTGLGLSMVQGFCEQSGGRMQIISKAGHGTSITLRLPASLEVPGVGPAPPAPRLDVVRILLVDDDADVLVTIGAFMTQAGFEIIRATGGDKALALLAEGARFDVIVTDYAMPGLNGADLIAQARLVQPGLPAVLITGFVEVRAMEGLPPGAVTLHKPFTRVTLLEAIDAVMGREWDEVDNMVPRIGSGSA